MSTLVSAHTLTLNFLSFCSELEGWRLCNPAYGLLKHACTQIPATPGIQWGKERLKDVAAERTWANNDLVRFNTNTKLYT